MKKGFIIFGGVVGSILGLALLTVLFVLYMVFTPKKLTPIVEDQLNSMLQCQTSIGQVELTFFSSFPQFQLQIDSLCLINPVSGAPNDTLLFAGKALVSIDIQALIKNKKLIVEKAQFLNPTICLYTDSIGRNNYSIYQSDTIESDTTAFVNPFITVAIPKVDLRNARIFYIDQEIPVEAVLPDLSAQLRFSMSGAKVDIILDDVSSKSTSVIYDKETYLKDKDIQMLGRMAYDLSSGEISIEDFNIECDPFRLRTIGIIMPCDSLKGYRIDQQFEMNLSSMSELLKMVPASYQSMIKGITAEGSAKLNGTVQGFFNDTLLPVVKGELLLSDIQANYTEMPELPVEYFSMSASFIFDKSNDNNTQINIKESELRTLKSTISLQGEVKQLMTDPNIKAKIKGNVNIPMISKVFLKEYGYQANGLAGMTMNLSAKLSQLQNMELDKIIMNGTLLLTNFDCSSPKDSLFLGSPKTNINFATNANKKGKEPSFLTLSIKSEGIQAKQGESVSLSMAPSIFSVAMNDFRDTTRLPDIRCQYDISELIARYGDANIQGQDLKGVAEMRPSTRNKTKPAYKVAVKVSDFLADGYGYQGFIKHMDANVTIVQNTDAKSAALTYIPIGKLLLQNGVISSSDMNEDIKIPEIDIDLKPNKYTINSSRIQIGESDFNLSGVLSDIIPYFKDQGSLKGDFTFTSDRTDLNSLMMMFNGEPSEEVVKQESAMVADTSSAPFMVPLNVHLALKTNIKQALFQKTVIENIQGMVEIHDGKLILDNLKLNMPACEMRVTAMYRTPKVNHIFAGVNFHMMDIEISELLKMIPDIDSIMPMLRSFDGKGEFHMAAETYMDKNYNLKKSTLRGAASITGQNLILMDGETFSEIAKMLRFNKKTRNVVDSLSTEFTLFKNEIDIYPFQIVMDKYRAVISGKHNLDMNFNYHISLTDSPLPIKLGMNITGNLDDMKFRLAPCKYKNMYRPASRKVVETSTLNLKEMIRKALVIQ